MARYNLTVRILCSKIHPKIQNFLVVRHNLTAPLCEISHNGAAAEVNDEEDDAPLAVNNDEAVDDDFYVNDEE